MAFVWMKHPDGSEAAPFAEDSVEFWQARGWERVEKPEEPDPTAEPRRYSVPAHPDGPEAFIPRSSAAETTTDTEPVADTKQKTAGRQRRAGTEES